MSHELYRILFGLIISIGAMVLLNRYLQVQAFIPLTLPIILIAASMLPKIPGWTGPISEILVVSGQPVIALGIGLALAGAMLISRTQREEWPHWISEALKDAGIILLITGIGGSFGYVIKTSGIDKILESYMHDSPSI